MKAKDYELFIISQNSLQVPTWLCTLLFQHNSSLVLNKRDYEYFMISQNNIHGCNLLFQRNSSLVTTTASEIIINTS